MSLGRRLGIHEDRAKALKLCAANTFREVFASVAVPYRDQDQAALDEARQYLLEKAEASQQDALVAFGLFDTSVYDMHIGMALGYWTAHYWDDDRYQEREFKANRAMALFVRSLIQPGRVVGHGGGK